MSSIKRPVGPQPPSVYWRRRLLVLLGLVAVIVVIVLIVVRPGAGDGQPAATESPAASEPADDAATSDPPADDAAAGGTCAAGAIVVTPVTDAPSYAGGAEPQISMSIQNTGSVDCELEVGTAAQEYVITSGADRIWSSRDCQTEPSQQVQTITAGQTLTTTPFPWNRTRSDAAACDAERTPVAAGGATYRLGVTLGEVTSAEDVPFLLND
jgi:hypothetical protein